MVAALGMPDWHGGWLSMGRQYCHRQIECADEPGNGDEMTEKTKKVDDLAPIVLPVRRVAAPPKQEPCHCKAFCLEDNARTGRYCRAKYKTR